jgi:hypothetical protein
MSPRPYGPTTNVTGGQVRGPPNDQQKARRKALATVSTRTRCTACGESICVFRQRDIAGAPRAHRTLQVQAIHKHWSTGCHGDVEELLEATT